jgi:type I restriction enzyme S subunit
MTAQWMVRPLAEVAELTVGHVGPMAAEYRPWGVPFLRSQDVEPFRIVTDRIKYIDDRFHERLRKSALSPGDVVIVRTGRPGAAAAIPDELPRANCSDLVIVRPGSELDAQFLVYYLNSGAQSDVDAHLVGAVQQHFNIGSARQLRIPVPSLWEQRAIASTLGVLDRQIELNRQTNETLQVLIAATYEQLTVGAGEWETVPVGEAVRVYGGSTPSTAQPAYWSDCGGYAWATPRDMSRLDAPVLLSTERRVSDDGLARISSGLLPIGTVLLSSRAPIGYLAISEVPTAINQGFIAMVCDAALPNYYVWQWTRDNLESIKSRSNGSTFEEISKTNFRPMQIPIPPRPELDGWVSAVEPLYRLIVAKVRESQTLALLRNTLLPELISGRMRVKGAGAAGGDTL